jgi:hypothetical protein
MTKDEAMQRLDELEAMTEVEDHGTVSQDVEVHAAFCVIRAELERLLR